MGQQLGFLKYKRNEPGKRPVNERIRDFDQLEIPLTPDEIRDQAARCMDCGIPFCHGSGCPISNLIPEFNDLVYRGKWKQACEVLHSSNNFPEMTGLVCPAPCEKSCTLDVNDEPVLIRHIEYHIVERGFQYGWIAPRPAQHKSGKRVAVIGSGPAGLAASQQLARKGHDITVFERDEKPGGLLRYGIPDFKLEKHIIDRRLNQLREEGVIFENKVNIGSDISGAYLLKNYDAVILTTGAREPRDLNVPGRKTAENVVFAMDYLSQQNHIIQGKKLDPSRLITAAGKNVAVIGGGDTGSDCVGTARRQGAKNVYQLEILPKPSQTRQPETPWPMWPNTMRTSSSHEEGCERIWSTMTKNLYCEKNRVSKLRAVKVDWQKQNRQWKLNELPKTEFELDVDLVLLSMGFVHAEHEGIVKELGLALDERGNVKTLEGRTSNEKVFAAGDTVSGASLVVRAISSGRTVAKDVDKALRK